MTLLAAVFLIALGSAQDKPEQPFAEPKRGDTVEVRGCVTGATIDSTDTTAPDRKASYSGRVTYRLTGNKKLLKQIKSEHVGHTDVLTGVLKSDLPHQNAAPGMRIGGTRVVVGGGSTSRSNRDDPPYLPVLEVKRIEHATDSCT